MRRLPKIALTAVTAAALVGCGGDSSADATDGCKDAVYERYDAALAAMTDNSDGLSGAEAVERFQAAVGEAPPEECAGVAPVFAQGIISQVGLEYSDKIDLAIAQIGGLDDPDDPDAESTASPDDDEDTGDDSQDSDDSDDNQDDDTADNQDDDSDDGDSDKGDSEE